MSISAISFILIFFSGCLASLLYSPFYGVLLYTFEYFLNPRVRWWYGQVPELRFAMVTMVVIFIGYLLKREEFRDNKICDVPQTKWLICLILSVYCASFWAVSPFAHDILSIRFFKYVVFVFFLYKVICTPKRMEQILGIYLLGTFYISWIGWQMGRTGSGRLEGIGAPDSPDVNTAAAMIVSAIPLLMFYILYGKNKWIRGCALVGLAFDMNCLILMSSRGAFVALVVSAGYFVFYVLKSRNVSSSVKVKIVTGIVCCIVLFLYLADASFWERMVTLKDIDPEEGVGRRMHFWLATFDMLGTHPLGLGGGGYDELSPRYLPAEWMSRGGGVIGKRSVHSVWFEVLSEYGYHGFIFFVGYVSSCFFLLRKVRKYLTQKGEEGYLLLQSVALEASFVAFLVAATFINRFYSEILYWLPGLIAVFANIYMVQPQKRKRETERSERKRRSISVRRPVT